MAQKYEQIINYGLQNKKSKQEIIAALVKENELNNAGTYIKQLDELGTFEGGSDQKNQDEQAKANLGTGDLLKQYYTNRNIVDKLNEYKTFYSSATKDNTILPTEISGENSAKLKSMYNDIIFQVAQAEGTGALQEADRKVVENMLPDVSSANPFTIGGQMMRGGKEGNVAAFDTLIKSAQERVNRLSGQEGTKDAQNSSDGQDNVADRLNKAVEFAKANPEDPHAKRFMDDWNNNKIDLTTGKLKDEFRELTPYEQKLKEQGLDIKKNDSAIAQETPEDAKKNDNIFKRFLGAAAETIPELTGDVGKRLKNIWDNTMSNATASKDRSVFENVLRGMETNVRNIGEVAGGVGDAGMRAVEFLYKGGVSEENKEKIKQAASQFMQTEQGQMALSALQGGVEKWDEFKQSNPNVAKDMEAVFNIVTAIPAGKGLQVAGKEAIDIAGDTLKGTAKIVGKDGTEAASKDIFKSVKPSITVARDKSAVRKTLNAANDEIVARGKKPANLQEYSDAIKETKKEIWGEIESKLQGGTGSKINLRSIADELEEMASNSSLIRADKGAAARIKKMAENLIGQGDEISVLEAEELKQFLNAELGGAFGKFNLSNAEQNAKKLITSKLGKQLDETLSSIPGEFADLKKKYGALRQTEEDVLKRLIVFGRQNPQGLVESFSKISGVGNILKGFIPGGGGVSSMAKGVGELAMGQLQKRANDADLLVKRAFERLHSKSQGFQPKSKLFNAIKDGKVRAGLSIVDESKKGNPVVGKTAENPLFSEARKYKSAEEFISHYQGSATQYNDYTPNLRLQGLEGHENISKLGVDPEKTVTIYRGIDDISGKAKRQINEGDFVTTDFDSALSYTGDPKDVVSMKVKAKDLYVSEPKDFADEPFYTGAEYIYTKQGGGELKTKSQLTDIWNKAQDSGQASKSTAKEAKENMRDYVYGGMRKFVADLEKKSKVAPNPDAMVKLEKKLETAKGILKSLEKNMEPMEDMHELAQKLKLKGFLK